MKSILTILVLLACSACAAPAPLLQSGQEIVIQSAPSRFDEAGTRKARHGIVVVQQERS